ncbi:MAG: DUF721 domain-containing protein [Epsilonproteobacteria bacterium]|nr:DUF721 domain-containing protein [Campylobacterota bacterium]
MSFYFTRSNSIRNAQELLTSVIDERHAWKTTLLADWPTIIGSMSKRVHIEKIDGRVLVLGVYHPTWAQELSMIAPMLKDKINKHLQAERIQKIMFSYVTPPKPAQESNKTSTKGKSPKTTAPLFKQLNWQEQQALCFVHDDELKSSLEQFYLRIQAHRQGERDSEQENSS